MSGWDAYVTTQLTSTGVVHQGAILGKTDMTLYAQDGGFQLLPSYSATVTADDGSEKTETIDEIAGLLGFFNTGISPKHGFRMNQVKYQMMRKLEEGPTLYLKCSGGGACISASNTLVIIGICKPPNPADAQVQLIQCNNAVEGLATYFRDNGY